MNAPAKTHCPKGHPYSGANLYVNPHAKHGKRFCRQCRIEKDRIRAAQRKAKRWETRETPLERFMRFVGWGIVFNNFTLSWNTTPVKCERCGRPFVNNNWLRSHEFEHEQEDQALLDKQWEENKERT